jgi:hypothetical protein
MRRDGQQVLGALAGACLVLVGCGSTSTCDQGPCPRATFGVHVLDDSTVTWTFSQSPSQTSTGFVTGEPSVGQCLFAYQGVLSPAGPGYRTFACNGGDERVFNFLGLDLGDPREWSVGAFTLVNRACATECLSCPLEAGATGKPCIMAVLDTVAVKVVVETATGTAVPAPKLVSDDFVRTFRLEFDTSAATARTAAGEVCDFPVAEKVFLHLTQSAADYLYDPSAPCPC